MRTLEQLCLEIQAQHAANHSWRKTAAPYGIFPSMARLIAMGYDPGPKIRHKLGLAQVARVVVVEGVVPEGTQAVSAVQCACGQFFISNHPRRKRCFICSPYRRRNHNNHKVASAQE